ncbi:Transforming growth factor beta-1-induced transcript 1 protein [Mactra antiquata]
MNGDTVYVKKVMEDLDALLADLQCTTAHISYSNQGPPPARVNSSPAKKSETPPPLPPPPQDIPDTIPPPQQFGDQPLYEAQNVNREYQGKRVSNSSQSSQGSGDPSFDPSQQQRYNPPLQQTRGSWDYPGGQSYQQQSQNRGQPPRDHSVQNYHQPQQQQQQAGMSVISNNLSELDQLLSDLNSAQFMAEVDKKQPAGTSDKVGPPPVAPKPSRGVNGGGQSNVGVTSSVDTLLNQLEESVPQSTHTGYNEPVNINSYHYESSGQQQQQQGHVQNYTYGIQQQPQTPVQTSSAATQELDDLMATLSDFKMKDKPNTQQATVNPMRRTPSPGSEPSYAKPQKSRNLSQSSSANSSLQSSSITGNVSNNTSTQGGQLESMLGDLQSDLNKQGVSTKTKGLCAACNQPVVGQVITALGKIWHIEHFSCAHCHETLGTKNFYERDGVAYCERDYHSLFAPRCGYCNGPIVDKCVTALNCTWHPEHFFCAQCGRPFGEEGFHEKDGKAYCRADFFEMFAPKCGGCGRAIVDNYISALNRHWHPECFACWECHQPFGGSSFFDFEGLPYCETHYHLKRGSLCAGCQKPIAGRCITAMYKKFHPEHFVCAFCLKQLNKGTFKEQNDRPYCHPCFVKLFG